MGQLKRFTTSIAVLAVALTSAPILATTPIAVADDGSAGGGAIVPFSTIYRRCTHSDSPYVRASGDGQGWNIISRTGSQVSARVVLQDATPDTQYTARLIQMPRAGNGTCGPGSPGTEVAPLFTDAAGNADMTLSQAVAPGATGAWVYIDGPMTYAKPYGETYTSDFVSSI